MNELMERAVAARQNAYAPYSGFAVGAACLAASGKIYTGSNVENSSYGLSNCAERTAIFTAAANGERKINIVAVAAGADKPVVPCGACLQVMAEFGVEWVWMGNTSGDIQRVPFSQLLPTVFSKQFITGE